MQTTSAYANKMLKKLQEEKDFLVTKERTNSTYVAEVNEDPVIPEFDFVENIKAINEIDNKIAAIKHSLNITNAVNKIDTDEGYMTIDFALVRMAQLNARKNMLNDLRKKEKKSRVNNIYNNKNIEYQYTNYDVADAQAEYDRVVDLITSIQLNLDKYNQTVVFDVDI